MKIDVTQIHKDIAQLENLAAEVTAAQSALSAFCCTLYESYGISAAVPMSVEQARDVLKNNLYAQAGGK